MPDPVASTSFWNTVSLKRDLWWQFTVRAVEMKHRGSYLGFLWAILNPLLMAALYVVVFGGVFKGHFNAVPNETAGDYALGVYLGLTLFHLVSETLAAAPSFVVGQPNLVKKVVFPLEVLPLSQLSAFWFHALINLGLFLIAACIVGRGLTLEGLLWFPVILLPLFLLTLGLGWLLAAVGVFFRDITQVVPLLSQILLWTSAVFFSVERIPANVWAILKWNPLIHTLDLSRNALLWDLPINLTRLGYTWIAGVTVFALGRLFFQLTKRSFPEAI